MQLRLHLQQLLKNMLSKQSWKIYQRAWTTYNQLINGQANASKLPISKLSVALFIAALDLAGYAARTITTYMSAISYAHKLGGWPDPCDAFLIKKLLDAIQKKNTSTLPKLPITLNLLHEILDVVYNSFPLYKATTYAALFSLAFHLCARVGELTMSNGVKENIICVDQVKLGWKGDKPIRIIVEFQSYKHKKQDSQVVRTVPATGGKYCPVRLLVEYLKVRQQSQGFPVTQKPKELFLSEKGSVMRSTEVMTVLRSCLHTLGREVQRYGTHSFRIGSATQAAVQGASDAELRMLGRWRSNAFLTYIRPLSYKPRYK